MENRYISDLDFTDDAWEALYDAVDDTQFLDKDAQLIYNNANIISHSIGDGDFIRIA